MDPPERTRRTAPHALTAPPPTRLGKSSGQAAFEAFRQGFQFPDLLRRLETLDHEPGGSSNHAAAREGHPLAVVENGAT